jgi:type II secretory pathway pseudopilin PulG
LKNNSFWNNNRCCYFHQQNNGNFNFKKMMKEIKAFTLVELIVSASIIIIISIVSVSGFFDFLD